MKQNDKENDKQMIKIIKWENISKQNTRHCKGNDKNDKANDKENDLNIISKCTK
jgi:hypothetical protein